MQGGGEVQAGPSGIATACGARGGRMRKELQPFAWHHSGNRSRGIIRGRTRKELQPFRKSVQWTRNRACDVILVSCAWPNPNERYST
eukprot:6226295-Prymnesium_polylepis.1